MRKAIVRVAVVAAIGLVGLSGCTTSAATDANATTPAPNPTQAASIALSDPWVKTAESGMTAAFGTLVNNTDKELTVVSATTTIANMIELHEVVMQNGAKVMRPKQGGFVVPAHGKHELAPGGDHIMIMGLKSPLKAGTEVSFTLTFADGQTLAVTAIAKEFNGGKESYQPTPMPSMSGMTMGH